jgi:hypothetical protein
MWSSTPGLLDADAGVEADGGGEDRQQYHGGASPAAPLAAAGERERLLPGPQSGRAAGGTGAEEQADEDRGSERERDRVRRDHR